MKKRFLGVREGIANPLVLLLFFLICLVFSSYAQLNGAKDDNFLFLHPFIRKFDHDYLAFLLHRYSTWSSRSVIELFTLLGVQFHVFWRLANSVLLTCAIALPPYLLKKNRAVKNVDLCVSAALFFTFPLTFFNETGWVATTTNYFWVYSLGLVSFYPIAKFLHREPVSKFAYGVGLLSLVYASNQEQMGLLAFGFLIVFLFYLLYQKKSVLFLLPYLIVNSASLLFIALAGGNKTRYAREVRHWFSDFDQLSLLRKVELGYSSTLRHLFFDQQLTILLVTFFVFCLALAKFFERKHSAVGILGMLPFILSGLISLPSLQKTPLIAKLLLMFNHYGTVIKIHQPTTWIPDLILSVIFFSLLVSLVYLLDYDPISVVPILFLVAGLCVRLVMGFSPTIWASATRTYIFTFGLFSLIYLFLLEYVNFGKNTRRYVSFLTVLIGAGCYIHLLFTM
ncbi:DUF6056 family protein [Enterococcus sp. CSURQ0835]|uniref:DUF6056 family protein n=1 Tax=Enterococcus sp. CSURQ0835 TaxID=2681394 RepID=UPI001359686A|nr:DUF6056 family protein [Enterococcus sp. CSURQ0835]